MKITKAKIFQSAMLLGILILTACGGSSGGSSGGGSSGGGSTTADTAPPTVTATTPLTGASDVAVNAQLTATFSEAMSASSVSATSFTLDHGVTGTVSLNGNTATFTPSANLAFLTTYTAPSARRPKMRQATRWLAITHGYLPPTPRRIQQHRPCSLPARPIMQQAYWSMHLSPQL
jgi:hypothetical protein